MNRLLIFIFISFLSFSVYGQDSICKNSFSLFIVPVPNSLFLATISYERFFNKKNSIEITGNYISYHTPNGNYTYGDEKIIFAEPAYRRYFYSKKDAKDISWISAYLSIYSDNWNYVTINHFGGSIDSGTKINYGLGVLGGRRLVFGKRMKIFLDVGIGGAYYIKRVSENENVAPRIVFRIGYRFV